MIVSPKINRIIVETGNNPDYEYHAVLNGMLFGYSAVLNTLIMLFWK